MSLAGLRSIQRFFDPRPEHCAFHITANASSNSEDDNRAAEIGFCVRYALYYVFRKLLIYTNTVRLRHLGDGCTGMANVEVEWPTGYEACDRSSTDENDPLCHSNVRHYQFQKHVFV